jgi:hypothetical protein
VYPKSSKSEPILAILGKTQNAPRESEKWRTCTLAYLKVEKSEYIYQVRLKNRERPGYIRPAIEPLPEKAWIVVVTGDEPTCQFERPSNRRSKYNPYHIHCDLRAVQRFLDSIPEAMHANQPRIGIITPYAPRARKIRTAVFEP